VVYSSWECVSLFTVCLMCRYTPLQVAAGVGVAATVLAGGVAAAKSPAMSEALAEQADLTWERLESIVPPLQVGLLAWCSML